MQLEYLLRGDADLYVDTLLRQEMPYERARGHLADAKGYLRAHRQAGSRQSAGLSSAEWDGCGHSLQSRWLGGQPMDGHAVYPRQLRHMSKQELFGSALSRWVLKHGGSVPIDRADPSPSSIKNAVGILQHGEIILIFPSGTRSEESIAFKRGAATIALHARVPLVPAFFQGPKQMQVAHLFHRPLIRVIFGSPIPTAELPVGEGDDDRAHATASSSNRRVTIHRGL
jgi:1-acyl-sn-glycerol-3-phosphate acyltransferase